ncbi:hypothetical protein Mnod_0109 [Methylobacterium nodulans ORS 2060]|uniref:Uncharacterized protein n=1 Tax=Methylobacterium nodulans (strain LMG 21967 / CNCM I-2342 / ORS 2060) TaxID=460265 RepID=B8IUB1_METNO|nr:hypothetical protein Mnod_0109 [Methylobacterium nodulans ORS 2060]
MRAAPGRRAMPGGYKRGDSVSMDQAAARRASPGRTRIGPPRRMRYLTQGDSMRRARG